MGDSLGGSMGTAAVLGGCIWLSCTRSADNTAIVIFVKLLRGFALIDLKVKRGNSQPRGTDGNWNMGNGRDRTRIWLDIEYHQHVPSTGTHNSQQALETRRQPWCELVLSGDLSKVVELRSETVLVNCNILIADFRRSGCCRLSRIGYEKAEQRILLRGSGPLLSHCYLHTSQPCSSVMGFWRAAT